MTRPAIVNIINFIRGVEPRNSEIDLVGTVEKQINLVQGHKLPATWLVQYDALTDPRFVKFLKGLDERQEVGAWFEWVQPLVEKAGVKWRGRYSWDWASDVGFSIGYTPEEREEITDVYMAEFKHVFGRYPRSVGSWLMDAHTLGYLADRYGVTASCNCKDQYGTDGYTLWGGYFNQAYYPSRRNALVPAQHKDEQIPLPVFRMLGSDPIYQYDAGIGGNGQGVVTLEPVYGEGGGSPKWVDWFFRTNFETPCLSFGYAQVGQENSFGWPGMADGLTYQVERLAEMAASGKVRVETLERSGKWFRSKYDVTPASAVTALGDWKNEGRKSVWYSSRFYRTNLFWDKNGFRIRDIHLFDEKYAERYLTKPCTTANCAYDTLPVVDGLLWSDAEETAGLRVFERLPDGSRHYISASDPKVTEKADGLRMDCGDGITILCEPAALSFARVGDKAVWGLEIAWAKSKKTAIDKIEGDTIRFEHSGYDYSIKCTGAEIDRDEDSSVIITATGSRISLHFTDED